MPWFDAHLDLSYLALLGRDMTARLDQPTGGPQPAALTFRSLAEGGVRWALGTIFINPGKPGETWGYSDASDPDGAHRAGARQLDIYHDWEQRGLIRIVRTARDLDDPAEGEEAERVDRAPMGHAQQRRPEPDGEAQNPHPRRPRDQEVPELVHEDQQLKAEQGDDGAHATP